MLRIVNWFEALILFSAVQRQTASPRETKASCGLLLCTKGPSTSAEERLSGDGSTPEGRTRLILERRRPRWLHEPAGSTEDLSRDDHEGTWTLMWKSLERDIFCTKVLLVSDISAIHD